MRSYAQPAEFGCILSFNANGVSALLPFLHHFFFSHWGWGILIIHVSSPLILFFHLSLIWHWMPVFSDLQHFPFLEDLVLLCVSNSSISHLLTFTCCHLGNGWDPTAFQRWLYKSFTWHIIKVQRLANVGHVLALNCPEWVKL